jgi:hypothetical protein
MTTEAAPTDRFLELASQPKSRLVAVMRRGVRPDPAQLDGWEYRGLNTATWMRIAGADRFVKGFAGDLGYNRRVSRGPRSAAWLPASAPDPKPFAPFGVAAVDPATRDNRYLNALLFDYSAHARGRFDPARMIRDYAVALDDSHELLLGHAFVAIGPARMHATFFVLERLRRTPGHAVS